MIKMKKILLLTCLLAGMLVSCSSDDDSFVDPVVEDVNVVDEVNVLLIKSDKGKTSTGYMYKSNEMYNPPHCYMGKEHS